MIPRIGIVATPDQVALLVPILKSLGFPVTAIWCKSFAVATKLSREHGIVLCARQFQDLLLHSSVDLVYVATEPGLQAEVTVKALTSGKHCVCQKPSSLCRAEAEKILSLSSYYAQLICIVESHLRFLPAFIRMRELVARGYCGRLMVIESRVLMGSLLQDEPYSWKCDPILGGGALSTVGPHLIDLVYFVSGKRAEKVHSCLKTFKSQTDKIRGYRTVLSDDFCAFEIQCSDNVCASVTINTHSIGGRFEFEFSVTGLDGRLVVRGLDLYGSRKDSPQEELLLKQRTEGEGEGEEGEMEVEGIDGIRRVPIAMGAHCTAAACGSMQSHQRAGFKEMFLALRMAFESTAASASMRPGVFTWGGGGGGGGGGGAVATGEGLGGGNSSSSSNSPGRGAGSTSGEQRGGGVAEGLSRKRTSPADHALIRHLATSAQDGLYLRTVLDCLYESDSRGQWVSVPKTNDAACCGAGGESNPAINPFWTGHGLVTADIDKHSPKTPRPILV